MMIRCHAAVNERPGSNLRDGGPQRLHSADGIAVNRLGGTAMKAFARNTDRQPFTGPLSRTTRVSRYQKGKTNLDFTEARGSEWQWHQLGRVQVCTSLQTDNHASTPPLIFYRPDALPTAQPTASKHRRQNVRAK